MPATEIVIGTDDIVQPFGGVRLQGSEVPILPKHKKYSEEVDYYPGEIIFGTNPLTRDFALFINVYKLNASKPVYLRQVAGWLDPRNGEILYKDENDPDKQLYVICTDEVTYKNKHNSLILKIPLVGRAFYESRTEHTLANSGTATNAGNYPAPCLIRFFGACTDPTITIGGTLVSYTGNLLAGEYVEIDMTELTAKKVVGAVETNIEGSVSGISRTGPFLNPGDNVVNTVFSTAVIWRDRWK